MNFWGHVLFGSSICFLALISNVLCLTWVIDLEKDMKLYHNNTFFRRLIRLEVGYMGCVDYFTQNGTLRATSTCQLDDIVVK